jgi:hypothetical protein
VASAWRLRNCPNRSANSRLYYHTPPALNRGPEPPISGPMERSRRGFSDLNGKFFRKQEAGSLACLSELYRIHSERTKSAASSRSLNGHPASATPAPGPAAQFQQPKEHRRPSVAPGCGSRTRWREAPARPAEQPGGPCRGTGPVATPSQAWLHPHPLAGDRRSSVGGQPPVRSSDHAQDSRRGAARTDPAPPGDRSGRPWPLAHGPRGRGRWPT